MDPNNQQTHENHIVDHYPRIIREAMEDGGEEGVRVASMVFSNQPEVYLVIKYLYFNNGSQYTCAAPLSRDEYDNMTQPEVVDYVKAIWYESLLEMSEWLDEVINDES